MTWTRDDDLVVSALAEAPGYSCASIALLDIESPLLKQAAAYWRGLAGERKFPVREDVTPRGLGNLLRNTTLVRVIEGGEDYEYRIVGDAFVLAHGRSFQGKKWSEIGSLSPRFHRMIKPVYDRVVATGEPAATRGWIERGSGRDENIFCEYVYLPLGAVPGAVDYLLVVAVYTPHDSLERSSMLS